MLPVHRVGQFPIHDNMKLQVFAGPYAALFVNGSQKTDSVGMYSSSVTHAVFSSKQPQYSYGPNTYINPLDFGLNIGAGFQVYQCVFSFAYSIGFTNIAGYTYNNDHTYRESHKLYNKGFTFGIAYLFGGKKK